MRRGAYGRPNTDLIPAGWNEHNGRTIRGTNTATCEVRATPGRTYDESTHGYVPVPGALAYAGKCRVQPVNRANVQTVAQQDVTTTDYQVTLDTLAEVVNGMYVTFQEAADPLLLGKVLIVSNVPPNTLGWVRVFACSDDQG